MSGDCIEKNHHETNILHKVQIIVVRCIAVQYKVHISHACGFVVFVQLKLLCGLRAMCRLECEQTLFALHCIMALLTVNLQEFEFRNWNLCCICLPWQIEKLSAMPKMNMKTNATASMYMNLNVMTLANIYAHIITLSPTHKKERLKIFMCHNIWY